MKTNLEISNLNLILSARWKTKFSAENANEVSATTKEIDSKKKMKK